MSFPRYPSYKESGLRWLARVPAHWGIVQSRRLFRVRNEPARQGDEPLTASQRYGILPQAKFVELESRRVVEAIKTADSLKHVEPGDFVISLRSFQGGIEYSRVRGAITFHYVVLQPLRCIHDGFFGYLFKSADYIQALRATTDLIRDGQDLRYSHFVQVVLPSVPIEEQAAIADFLDRETAKIDALVAEQQRLIELLKEKRQAIISHAVTKGLNPDVAMKPSGIEWLGDVPAHWKLISLGRITIARCDGPFGSGLKSEHYTNSGVRVVRLQNIKSRLFDGTDVAYIDANYYESQLSGHDVLPGDVLIAGLGDDRNTVGRACVAPSDIGPAMVKADCFRFRLDTAMAFADFVASVLSVSAPADAGVLSSGSTRSRIPLSIMSSRRIPLPPLNEQREIASFIDNETRVFDRLVSEAQKAIDLLQERRTALISAAVTGQIDVRGLVQPEAA